MQKTLPILGVFAILFVGMISPAMAEDNQWEEKYRAIENEFQEKRQHIDNYFQEEFEELDRQYGEVKMEIYEKIDSNPEITDSEMDRMFNEMFLEFDEKRQSLESDMMRQYDELDEAYENELRSLENDARQYYEEKESVDENHYENDPEWESIELLANKIMESIPMEKIQRLWEAGQIEELVEVIVAETDLSYEEAKRVVYFFEKYDNRDDHGKDNYQEAEYTEHEYREYDYKEYGYEEPHTELYPAPVADNGEILRLEQRITELEVENQMLRENIAQLEEKIAQINEVVMEQIKLIYEWTLSQ